ncbi:hypothetical protein ACFPQ1_37205 [Rhodocytophaga aerolata]|uniref:hypothetical protein n=1 Tax=Rhodocytophaga aerolata TaxID=455078 RepID=UPI00265D541A|nr:hypothetical protein [Rhodocytophaga aerolata]
MNKKHTSHQQAFNKKAGSGLTGSFVLMNFTLYGICQTYHNYRRILLANSNGGSAFEPSPTKVKGNIIKGSNLENYALGYFQ